MGPMNWMPAASIVARAVSTSSTRSATTGPVVAFRVDDVDAARATMEAAGIQFIGPIQRAGKASWNHFRAPDGTVFEILSQSDDGE